VESLELGHGLTSEVRIPPFVVDAGHGYVDSVVAGSILERGAGCPHPTPPAAATPSASPGHRLVELPLKFGRREVAQSRVPVMGVIKPFQIIEDRRARLGASPESFVLRVLPARLTDPVAAWRCRKGEASGAYLGCAGGMIQPFGRV